MTIQKEILNKDELRKSLEGLGFTSEEVNDLILKAEKEGKFEEEEEEEDDPSPEDMEKAYSDLEKMYEGFQSNLSTFLDKYGKVPGFKTPTFDVKEKSIENDIEKGLNVDFGESLKLIQKSIQDQFDQLQVKLEESTLVRSESIEKSLNGLHDQFEEFLNAPNPLKSILGNYSPIEKGIRENENGKQIVSRSNKKMVQDCFMKAIDKVEAEDQKEMLRAGLSNLTIVGNCNPKAYSIVEKALDVEFEK